MVYISLIADIFHAGHARLIVEGNKYGKTIVGLLTEEACSELSETPILTYEKEKRSFGINKRCRQSNPQKTASYLENLNSLKPKYVIHGDDWKNNFQKIYRSEVLNFFDQNPGKLVEIPYSTDVNPLKLKEQALKNNVGSFSRNEMIKHLIRTKGIIRILEVHNPLSALIAETAIEKVNNLEIGFDGFWSSSLTDSTSKGKPDIEAVDISSRIKSIDEIFDVTTKPMIFDGDTGGKPEHLEFTIRSLERIGVGAIIIEDKIGLKKNSLFGNDVFQEQDSIENFSNKISVAKRAQKTEDFLVIARIESLILENGMQDALTRSHEYIKAGADGVMIHSRIKDGKEIIEFIKKFRAEEKKAILVVVPTSFNHIKFEEFKSLGVNVVIYANHLLRAAYPNMKKVASEILLNGRSLESENICMPIKEILNLIPGTK